MKKIIWTNTAVKDLNHIFEYIAADSKIYAQALIVDIFLAIEQLESFPKSGRVVPEIKKKNTREIFVGSYRIIYEILTESVHILTILHGARKL